MWKVKSIVKNINKSLEPEFLKMAEQQVMKRAEIWVQNWVGESGWKTI